MSPAVGRRGVLKGGFGVVGGALLLPAASGRPAVAEEPGQVWSSGKSQNGWPVVGDVPVTAVEGSALLVGMLSGDVATVLLHCARRLCYELGEVDAIAGHTTTREVKAPFESNYLSGTAIAIRPAGYPVGVAGGFFAREVAVIRDVLAECDGVVRWGGDLRPAKESHFQIDVPPGDSRLAAAAAKIASWRSEPGEGAGTIATLLRRG
ncbi:hypothetical protein JNUCC0626_48130 [Lentzea sp. JNUCC 0626]|uniref:hypothetical protein n=1 Tax=Lentzea sp. JNUCC 0626 TaxID=3367513 RepID=UPI003749A387